MTEDDHRSLTRVALSAAGYGLWFVTSALGIFDLLLTRGLLLESARFLGISPWAHAAIDKWGLVLLGIGWLIVTGLVEAAYQKAAGISLRRLLYRFALVTGAQLLYGGVVALLTVLMM
jgi:hypothetical protein